MPSENKTSTTTSTLPSKGARIAMAMPVILVAGLLATAAGGGLVMAGYGLMKSMGALVMGGLAITAATGYVLPHLTKAIPTILNGNNISEKQNTKTARPQKPSKTKKKGILRSLFKKDARKKAQDIKPYATPKPKGPQS